MWKFFIFSLLCCMKQEEAPQPHFCKHLRCTPAAKHVGFPHHSPSAPAQQERILLLPMHRKAVQPHSAVAGEDVSSFCQSFSWYFIGGCVSLLMIPAVIVRALNHPRIPLILISLHPFSRKKLLVDILQHCLQEPQKNFVSKKSRKW